MPVRFQNSSLIPAPFVNITKEIITNGNNSVAYPSYVFTLTGTIVNVGESLDSPGVENSISGDMDDILAEQARIRGLFDVTSGLLEIEDPSDTTNKISTYCKVESVEFSPSTWTVRCDYTIVLRSFTIDESVDTNIADANDTWTFQENTNGTVSITHSLSATGFPIYGSGTITNDPLANARDWCHDRSVILSTNGVLSPLTVLGLQLTDPLIDLGVTGSGNFWNQVLSENASVPEFTWGLEETFIYDPSGVAREDFKVSTTFDQEDWRKSVISLNGIVTGNADKQSNLALRNTRASGHFHYNIAPNLFARANIYKIGGFTVSPLPSTRQVTYNVDEGTVEYNYTFNAASGFLFTEAISEEVNIIDNGTTDVFAKIQVPGRTSPLFQNMRTKTSPTRTININLIFPPTTSGLTTSSILGLYKAKPNTNTLIQQLVPESGYYYVTNDTEEWNPIKRIYSRSISWDMDNNGILVAGTPSGIRNLPSGT